MGPSEDLVKLFEKVDVILLDIEGTTTSINFVKDVLFKYARDNANQFLIDNFEDQEVRDVIRQLSSQAIEDKQNGFPVPYEIHEEEQKLQVVSSVYKYVLVLMDQDRKLKPLKTLQGLLWKNAYRSRRIQGHIYEDILPSLQNWKEEQKKIYIYSSGSVQAQKLLFQYSIKGNLLEYFDGHFDTTIGGKKDKKSYEAIVEELKTVPESILFLTDIVEEAKAAKEAGINVLLSERPENQPLTAEDKECYPVIKSFMSLRKENAREDQEFTETATKSEAEPASKKAKFSSA